MREFPWATEERFTSKPECEDSDLPLEPEPEPCLKGLGSPRMNAKALMEFWRSSADGIPDLQSEDEMLIVRNTFLELCKMAESGIDPDRFMSAPAAFPFFGETAASAHRSVEQVHTPPPPPPPSDERTTIMVRNIPTRISSKTLMDVCFGAEAKELVDFLYLPIDFKTNKNLGYCFINFKNGLQADKFMAKFDGRKYVFCDTSEKMLAISYSNRQGYLKNLEVFTQTKLLDTWPAPYRPLAEFRGELVPIDSLVLAEILVN